MSIKLDCKGEKHVMNQDGMEKKEVEVVRRISTSFFRAKLIREHGQKCGYCGCEMISPELIELSSYYPFRTHPEHMVSDNYILSCPTCHRIKCGKEPEADDGAVLILHPYRESYKKEIIFDKNGLAHGLTEAGRSTIDIMHLNRPELVAYRMNNIASFIETVRDGKKAVEVYKDAIEQIKKLMEVHIEDQELIAYYNRMVYANIIATMEAYLSKTIIMLVLGDEELFWRFVHKFDWNKEKISVSDIKEVYDGMNMKVQTALAEVIYHNLPKVKKMYELILEIDILTDEEEMSYLCSAINIRHDIVHRNGRKKTDSTMKEFHVIKTEDINELISHVDKLVDDIEEKLLSNDEYQEVSQKL